MSEGLERGVNSNVGAQSAPLPVEIGLTDLLKSVGGGAAPASLLSREQ